MTVPLPAEGDTSWYDWATGIDAAARTKGPAVYPESANYFTPTLMRQSGAAVQSPVGTLNAQMLILGRAITLSTLTVQVGTAGDAGSVFRMGVYGDNGNYYPGSLLLDAGTVLTAATGRVSVSTSLALAAGVYWLAGAVQTATTVPFLNNSVRGVQYFQLFGDPAGNPGDLFNGNDFGSQQEGFSMTGVTGALPGTFSTTHTRLAGAVPMIVGQAA